MNTCDIIKSFKLKTEIQILLFKITLRQFREQFRLEQKKNIFILLCLPEIEPRGSNSSKASTSWFCGDAEAPGAVVAWLGILLTGEESLGAEAAGVSPPLTSRIHQN